MAGLSSFEVNDIIFRKTSFTLLYISSSGSDNLTSCFSFPSDDANSTFPKSIRLFLLNSSNLSNDNLFMIELMLTIDSRISIEHIILAFLFFVTTTCT